MLVPGDKVKHKNTGDMVYDVLKINKCVAVIKRQERDIIKIGTMKVDSHVCNINNLIKI